MIDGADPRVDRFTGAGGGGGGATGSGTLSLLLLENMPSCLDELAWIPHHVGQPYLVVNMRAGTAPGRSKPADRCAFLNLSANRDKDR